MLAQAQVPGALGQGAAIDQLGAGLGERAFTEAGELLVQFAREHELQDGVAQEFEALVGLGGGALLMRDRGMGQGEPQKGRVAKDVTHPLWERIVSGLGGHGVATGAGIPFQESAGGSASACASGSAIGAAASVTAAGGTSS